MISIEPYRAGLEQDLWEVYHTAIRLVCTRDYSPEQVRAWAPDDLDPQDFADKLGQIQPFIAVLDGQVAGYADLQADGYIDHFFVHGRLQGKGVGSALMGRILTEGSSLDRLYSHVSVTAKSFFKAHGFAVIKEQRIELRGQWLKNSVMERLG